MADSTAQSCHKSTLLQEHDHFSRLNHDAMDIIVRLVYDEDRQGLFMLSLVSKLFYFACMPWTYRHIVIDFSYRRVNGLLRRLQQTPAQLNTFVRTVTLKGCDKASMDQWRLLHGVFSSSTRLESLSWDSHANLPPSLLGTIHNNHPGAMLEACISRVYAANGTSSFKRVVNVLCIQSAEGLLHLDSTIAYMEVQYS
jgi:hypothetical protein